VVPTSEKTRAVSCTQRFASGYFALCIQFKNNP
jgi:hypothetical protein